MNPTSHAVVMLAVPVFTAAACIAGCRRRPTLRRALFVPLPVFAGLALVAQFFIHACAEGNPFPQLLLWGACAAALLICISRLGLALAVVTFLSVIMGFTCWNYTEIVHSRDLTGNPRAGPHPMVLADRLERLRQILRDAGSADSTSYPAGWVSDEILPVSIGQKLRMEGMRPRRELTPFWHSGFTQLWVKKEVPIGLWYPGGTMKDAAAGLEWRDRTGR